MVRLGRVVERGAPDTGVKGEAEDSKLPRIGVQPLSENAAASAEAMLLKSFQCPSFEQRQLSESERASAASDSAPPSTKPSRSSKAQLAAFALIGVTIGMGLRKAALSERPVVGKAELRRRRALEQLREEPPPSLSDTVPTQLLSCPEGSPPKCANMKQLSTGIIERRKRRSEAASAPCSEVVWKRQAAQSLPGALSCVKPAVVPPRVPTPGGAFGRVSGWEFLTYRWAARGVFLVHVPKTGGSSLEAANDVPATSHATLYERLSMFQRRCIDSTVTENWCTFPIPQTDGQGRTRPLI